jgi:hypothetical protein
MLHSVSPVRTAVTLFFLLALLASAACMGSLAASKSEACFSDSDCTGGAVCGYSLSGGCEAIGVCVTPSSTQACGPGGICGCPGIPAPTACISSGYANAPTTGGVGPCTVGENDGGADDGNSNDASDADICSERTIAAQNATVAAEWQAEANLACQADSDCVVAPNSNACSNSCGVVLNQAGAAQLQAAIAQINATTCANFVDDGCQVNPAPPCTPLLPSCVFGACSGSPLPDDAGDSAVPDDAGDSSLADDGGDSAADAASE